MSDATTNGDAVIKPSPFACRRCGGYVAVAEGYATVNLGWQHYRCPTPTPPMESDQEGGS